ncbi:MAG: YdcH family protein [Pseudomonadota bacterium]
MSHTPHELADDFPELTDQIHALKTSNAHFAKRADEYHEINRTIHRAETGVEPISPVAEEDLRKQRMALKDELYGMLKAAD